MQNIDFIKMQGIGNDYIYVNDGIYKLQNKGELSIRLSDRHFGVGGDGVVYYSSEANEFNMQIFNSDGSEANICGNALRCLGKLLYEEGYCKSDAFIINTKSGKREIWLDVKGEKVNRVAVNMKKPSFDLSGIPCTIDEKELIAYKMSSMGKVFNVTCVSVGNPHLVILNKDLSNTDFIKYGRYFSTLNIFPEGINVEFVHIDNRQTVQMRVFERGAGETLACGSGATATFCALRKMGLIDKSAYIIMAGGELKLSEEKTGDVIMSGNAEYAFKGSVFI